jgi:GDP-L-fucose synthase
MINNNSVILVTGSRGFLGHHVVQKLEEYRDDKNHPERKSIRILDPTKDHLDLLSPTSIKSYFFAGEPDIVIHLAAQCGGLGINSEKPGEFLYNNLMMTTNLIEQCSLLNRDKKYTNIRKVEKFVGLGSVCAYPKYTPVPFKEEDLYNGYPEETNAPYGLAKKMQLEMLKAYREQYGFNGIFLIPTNMSGEWDNFDDDSSHVIPAMLKKFHQAKLANQPQVTLWGDGSASREFLYASDCAEAILLATLHYDNPEPVNAGTGNEITMKELAEKVQQLVGYEGQIEWDTTKLSGQPRRCLDVSRAKNTFGFEAHTSIDDILTKTYEWAKIHGELD